MLTLALLSQKGGAGKSTLALHLAAEACARGIKSVLLDLDPQGNVAKWSERRGEKPPDVSAEHPANLERAISEAEKEGYSLCVLDTAPHADRTALVAARASDLIVSPCRPSTFDLEALQTTLDLCLLTKRPSLVVLNAAPLRSRVTREATARIRESGGEVCSAVVHHRVAFQHCLIDGRVASEFEPEGQAAREICALFESVMACLHADTPTAHQAG